MPVFYNPLLTLRINNSLTVHKGRALAERLSGSPPGARLFRVRSDLTATVLQAWLAEKKITAPVLSPGLLVEQRKKTISSFKKNKNSSLIVAEPLPLPVKPAVRSLWLMNLPPSLPALLADLQAVGRDGLLCQADVFASQGDFQARLAELEQRYECYQEASKIAGESEKSVQETQLNRENLELFRKAAEALQAAVAWAEHAGCAWAVLRQVQGEDNPSACGNCDWCLGARRGLLPVE